MSPNFRAIYKKLLAYQDEHSKTLSQEQLHTLAEIKRRVRRLEHDYNRLMNINGLLLEAKSIKVDFDAESGTMKIQYAGGVQTLKLARANPDVPIEMVVTREVGAYKAGAPPPEGEDPSLEDLRMQMEREIEGYYYNSFHVAKLVQALTGRKCDCREVTIVRNKLIEHPEVGSIYSFGFSSDGPLVKPLHREKVEWRDLGLIHNTSALVSSLAAHLSA